MVELGVMIYGLSTGFLINVVLWLLIWRQSKGKMKVAALFMIAYLLPAGIIFMSHIFSFNSESLWAGFAQQYGVYIEVFRSIMFVGTGYYIYLSGRRPNVISK